MRRWFVGLLSGGAVLLAFACDDETVEVVPKDVCYSEMRWVGEKRGSPEMFPGRDCVGCHIENDGPPLALGGTVYPYVLGNGSPGLLAQTGTDCFGVEGITVRVEDADGQPFELTTNRAGNFFVEGNPQDFKKPFSVSIHWINGANGNSQNSQMSTAPSYGGCGKCHNPAIPPTEAHELAEGESADALLRPTARIGLPGNGPGEGYDTIEDELTAAGCELSDEETQMSRACQRVLNPDD